MTLHLDDLRVLRQADKIANLYHLLGYRADLEPQGYSAEEAQFEGAAANSVKQVYLLSDLDGLQHIHLETTDLSTPALRRVAENVLKRSGHYLLSFADPEYQRVIFVKPSRSEGAVRISKLILEPQRPTRHDAHTLEAMRWLPDKSGEALHLRQIEAFNVERVTQEFFEVYKKLFGQVKRTLVEQNPHAQIGALRKQTTLDTEAVHAFTQRLLGRIIFLYFIQKKGWLNGQSDFLKKTYVETTKLEGANFYRDALEPLFFETLNTQRPGNRSPLGSIPYLNGSLFEREYPDSTVLSLPNTLFDPALKNSVLGVFEHYSFTVEESSSLESDVSLDPEMLGKVFENLMEKGEAAASGTFYTPRSIVRFLSEESLSRYLSDKTGISLERIRPLLAEGDDYFDLEREEARSIKKALEVAFPEVYVGTGDLYLYFFQKALNLLRPGGRLGFITPNKFLKAGYGEKLRGVLSADATLEMLIDFGDLPVFDATTYPFITLAKKAKPSGQALEMLPERTLKAFAPLSAALSSRDNKQLAVRTVLSTFHLYARTLMAPLERRELTAGGWVLDDPRVLRLLEKLRGKGVKLGELIDGKFYYGIKTGYNEAFVIDNAKRLELIAADPRSAEIIKPFLRGKDIRRWRINSKKLYLLTLQNSGDADCTHSWRLEHDETKAREIFASNYPAIHERMSQFEEGLRLRTDQGRFWWELRACAYYQKFLKPKIIYPDMAQTPRFCSDLDGSILGNTSYFLSTNFLWLTAILNSRLVTMVMSQLSPAIMGGSRRYFSAYLEQLPIITPTPAQQIQLEGHTDDSRLDELNALVYEMYGLTPQEITLVESLTGGVDEALEAVLEETEGEAVLEE